MYYDRHIRGLAPKRSLESAVASSRWLSHNFTHSRITFSINPSTQRVNPTRGHTASASLQLDRHQDEQGGKYLTKVVRSSFLTVLKSLVAGRHRTNIMCNFPAGCPTFFFNILCGPKTSCSKLRVRTFVYDEQNNATYTFPLYLPRSTM